MYCGQTVGWIRMPLAMEVPVGLGPVTVHGVQVTHGVRLGPSSPLPKKKGTAPHFRPMSTVAKRMDGSTCHLLRLEVGLGPGDIVLDGDPTIGIPNPGDYFQTRVSGLDALRPGFRVRVRVLQLCARQADDVYGVYK